MEAQQQIKTVVPVYVDQQKQEMLAALKAALPHVERIASFAPTTQSGMLRVLQARKDRDMIRSVLAKAEG